MISFRDAQPDDLQLVLSNWSRSYKGSPAAGIIPHDQWPAVMRPIITRLIARPGNRTVCAFERDDPWFIYGWICGDTTSRIPVVHYCYVKEAHRRTGIARSLFGSLGVLPTESFEYSGWTNVILKIKTQTIPFAKYVPDRATNPAKDFHGYEDRTETA